MVQALEEGGGVMEALILMFMVVVIVTFGFLIWIDFDSSDKDGLP